MSGPAVVVSIVCWGLAGPVKLCEGSSLTWEVPMTTAIPSLALVIAEPVFTEPEQRALAGSARTPTPTARV
jgi:hypothetical protein